MKKYLITFSMMLVLILSFGSSALAMSKAEAQYQLSEDLQTLYYGNTAYYPVDTSELVLYWQELDQTVALSDTQRQTIKDVTLYADGQGVVIEATIQYTSGTRMITTYLRSDCFSDYQDVMSDEGYYEVDFGWPSNNIVTYDKSGYFGEKEKISGYILEWGDVYFVYKTNTSLSRGIGGLIVNDDEYYYLDFKENQTDSEHFYYEEKDLFGYRITDPELISRLDVAKAAYYSEDVGFLYDDNLSQSVSAVLLCVVFGLIPLGILITCLILMLRTKKTYKKIFATICILSVAELAVFTIVATIIAMSQ